jgi:hypothetical protein
MENQIQCGAMMSNNQFCKILSNALGALYVKHAVAAALAILLSIFFCSPLNNVLHDIKYFDKMNELYVFSGSVAIIFILFLCFTYYRIRKIFKGNSTNKTILKFVDYLELAELRGFDSKKVQLAFEEGVDWFFDCLLICEEDENKR